MKKELRAMEKKDIFMRGLERVQPSGPDAPKTMSWRKELMGLLCLLLALGVFCAVTVPVLTPKRHDYGATWGMYSEEPENSLDVLFFGSSLVYCDIVPSVLYGESGVSSYVMAGPEQTMPVTYRYLREACKTQQPQTVFIEATGLLYGQRSRSTKVNLTYMPWGMNRLIPVFQEILTEGADTEEKTLEMERETRTGLLFPLYAYHDRWDDLEEQDYQEGLWGYEPDLLAGYTFLDKVTPIEGFEVRSFSENPENYARNLEYAGKMVEFCQKQGIRPVFFMVPLPHRVDGEQKAEIATDLTGLGAEFVDFNDFFDEPGFDLSLDFYDHLHLNYRGAEKFSGYLAERLPEWGVTPSGREDKALWQERAGHFDALRDQADSEPVKLNSSK